MLGGVEREKRESASLGMCCAYSAQKVLLLWIWYGIEAFFLSLSLFSRQEAMLLLLAFFAPVPFSPSLFPFSPSLLRNVSDSDSLPFNSLYPPRQKKEMGTRQKDGGDGDEMEL